jgi:high-affinity Fe2+/Pb2+ permease
MAFVALLLALLRRLGSEGRMATIAIGSTTVAIAAAGSLLRSLQDAGFVGSTPVGVARSVWLSLWPTAEGLLSQLIIASACLGILLASALAGLRRQA